MPSFFNNQNFLMRLAVEKALESLPKTQRDDVQLRVKTANFLQAIATLQKRIKNPTPHYDILTLYAEKALSIESSTEQLLYNQVTTLVSNYKKTLKTPSTDFLIFALRTTSVMLLLGGTAMITATIAPEIFIGLLFAKNLTATLFISGVLPLIAQSMNSFFLAGAAGLVTSSLMKKMTPSKENAQIEAEINESLEAIDTFRKAYNAIHPSSEDAAAVIPSAQYQYPIQYNYPAL